MTQISSLDDLQNEINKYPEGTQVVVTLDTSVKEYVPNLYVGGNNMEEKHKKSIAEGLRGMAGLNTHNPITNPKHYDMQPRPADVIMDWGMSWAKGNALKYIVRAGKKDGNTAVQDLEKAIQCLRMEIERLQRDGEV